MSIFAEQQNTQAYLKAGIMGFAGSGKTFTATEIAMGLIELGRSRGLEFGDRPVAFYDTETGSDWVAPKMRERGIRMVVAKTRSFSDILAAMKEAEESAGVLIIDSITHVWRELCSTYSENKRGGRRLEFQDWAVLKEQWSKFTDAFVNSRLHVILCGRAGYEYDFFEDDDGKKQLEKTGIKMKAEGEMGYEPSLLVHMERQSDPADLTKVRRVAHVLKDRADRLDGKSFRNPSFDDFVPHVLFLNLGGRHVGVDTTRNSADQFAEDGTALWRWQKQQKQIALEEIQEEMTRQWPGRTQSDTIAKGEFLERIFGTRSWTAVEARSLDQLKDARNRVWLELRGFPYGERQVEKVEPERQAEPSDGKQAVTPDDSAKPKAPGEPQGEALKGEPKGRRAKPKYAVDDPLPLPEGL